MTSFVLAATGIMALLGGCTGIGEPLSAGHASAASAPVRLWPDRKPAPLEEPGRGENLPATVPGVPKVPSGDIRKASLLTVVKAQVARAPPSTASRSSTVPPRGRSTPVTTSGRAVRC